MTPTHIQSCTRNVLTVRDDALQLSAWAIKAVGRSEFRGSNRVQLEVF